MTYQDNILRTRELIRSFGGAWDGTYNGKPVADGTYYYIVTFRLINGQLVELSGNVTILR